MASNPTVIITGITGTLGRAVRTRIIEQQDRLTWANKQLGIDRAPWNVVGCSRHGSDEWDNFKVDVTNPVSVAAWFDALEWQKVNVYALVTCAGVVAVSPTTEQKPADFRRVLDTNVFGTWLCIREAARRGVKRIVTVGSLLGGAQIGYPDRAAYIASKAAVAGMTRALAVELAPAGVAVNCVAPGHFSLMASKAKGLLKGALGRSPMGRLVTPDEVADVIAWLVTDAPKSLTGETIVVDGGYSISAYPVARWWEE